MNAEFNEWSVTIYSNGDEDVPVLKRIMDVAREQKIGYGSVGVIPLPPGCKKRRKGFVFVTLLHCDTTQAEEIFRLAGVTVFVPLVEAKFVPWKHKKSKKSM